MKVPSTKGGVLLTQLEKAEELLTRVSKYTVKYVEQGGVPLALMFNTNLASGKCSREECMVCPFSKDGRKSGCLTKNIVYESECKLCTSTNDDAVSDNNYATSYRYVGESSRTLYERVAEHREDASKLKESSHIA